MRTPGHDHSVLVVGAGSIGSRHLRNLRGLGVDRLAVCDPDADRRQAAAKVAAQAFGDVEHALAEFKPNIVFVCTPPSRGRRSGRAHTSWSKSRCPMRSRASIS